MDAKIQELTDKIYTEGVEKGQVEANRLIAEAEAKAQKIEAEASRRAKSSVQALTTDKAFVQGLILRLAERFDLSHGLEITTADADSLRAYFTAHAKGLLEQGVTIREVAGKPTDFAIAPRDGSFRVQFGEAEFVELFKSFLRPEMTKMLF